MGHSRRQKKTQKVDKLKEPKHSPGPPEPAGSTRVSSSPGIRKQPRQQRSIQMVEAIEQAAAEVFAELGYAGATTNKIAERAGVSVGSLYQYFPDKDSLLAVLWERHHAEIHEVVHKSLARLADPSAPLEESLRELLKGLVAVHQADPALTSALSSAVLRESSIGYKTHADEESLTRAKQLAGLLTGRPDVRQGDHFSMAAVASTAMSQLTRWLSHDAPSSMNQEALVEETVQLLVRYLHV